MPFPSGFTDLTWELDQPSFVFGELGFRPIAGQEAFGDAHVSGYQSSFFTSWDLALIGFVIGGAAPSESLQPSRIASGFSETAGDIVTGVPQQDVNANEVVPLSEQFGMGDVIGYRTITRPTRVLKRVRISADMPQAGAKKAYRYRSQKGLLSQVFPDSIAISAEDAFAQEQITATQAVQYVFNRWQAQYPDLVFEAVPTLYLFIPNEEGVYDQEPLTEAIYLPQSSENRRSMQRFLEDLLRIFIGYKFVLTADDTFAIRPPEWSPEYDRGTIEVGENEVIAPFPPATLDDSTVRNLWTVDSPVLGFGLEAELAPPQSMRAGDYLGDEINPDPMAYQVLSHVTGNPGQAGWTTAVGTLTFRDDDENPILISGDHITLSGSVMGWLAWSPDSGATNTPQVWTPFSPSPPPNPANWLLQVPVGGSAQTSVQVSNYVNGSSLHLVQRVTIVGRFMPSEGGATRLQITASRTRSTPGGFFISRSYEAFVVRIDQILGETFGETGETNSGAWGQTEGELQETSGLALSQQIYGIREGSLRTTFFTLDNLQCTELARSLARYYMNPRTRYNGVGLTVDSDIFTEDIWRRSLLPNGAVAVLDSYDYRDARTYTGLTARTTVSFEALYDLASTFADPAASAEGFAFGVSGMSFYAN